MYISSFQLTNYKSFATTSALALTPGFNLITGPNNVGKTTLLEAMTLNFVGKPHRSLSSMPTAASSPQPLTVATVELTITNEELSSLLLVPGKVFYIPVPEVTSQFARRIGFRDTQRSSLRKLVDWLSSQNTYTFQYKLVCDEGTRAGISQYKYPALLEMSDIGTSRVVMDKHRLALPVAVAADKSLQTQVIVNAEESYDFGMSLGQELVKRVYGFHAQRISPASCPVGQNRILNHNAGNLAEVLNVLKSNPNKFERFNELVRQVIPQVRAISLRPAANNNVEILVWNHDPRTEREDLAFSLDESGTGIGQVLSILYVVFTSGDPQTITIDEPQTFLHRGAARKLIEILKQYPQHQYIIATHSPTVISATNPSTITLVRQHEGESNVEILDAAEVEQQRVYLAQIGATPADVFGYDNVLWVEGETEEICFPRIVEQVNKTSLMGTAIKRVKHTGDFETRDASVIFDIYDRLSHGKSLLPPAVGFLFDDECRTEAQKKEMRSRSENKVIFTTRRMYENYLLNPAAIASVINDTITLSAPEYNGSFVTPEEVSELLEQKGQDKTYFDKAQDKTGQDNWQTYIHAGKVLADLFSELSRNRAPVTFDKIRHSIALTDWVIEHKPSDLDEIANLLAPFTKTKIYRSSRV